LTFIELPATRSFDHLAEFGTDTFRPGKRVFTLIELLVDSLTAGPQHGETWVQWYSVRKSANAGWHVRHRQKANLWFADGHVSAYAGPDMRSLDGVNSFPATYH